MAKTSGVQLNSNHDINHFELKNAVLISDQPALLNGIFHFIKSDLVGIEIIYSGSWDKYRNANLNLTDSFVILIPFKEREAEIIAQISHFYELDIPVLLMHDSALDDSLKDILRIAPSVVVENNCSLDVLYTAFLEIIEKNFTWKSSEIKKVVETSSKTAYSLSPREKESLALYASGLTLREVASKLQLSPNSVGKFISRGKDKLNKSGASVNSKTSIYLELKKRNLIR
jgi:DNA-binding NarL/FixJ family response regulator